MTEDLELSWTADDYLRFAREEASGRSPLYERLTEGVAADPEVLALLGTLPRAKRQPNLLLAVVRYLYDLMPTYAAFRGLVTAEWAAISATMLTRRTQTNEVARCATLLPLLSALPQPLALIEVGASAGLCLLLDRYRYDFGRGVFGPTDSPVTLGCALRGAFDVAPSCAPEVAWRAGLDLEPIDVHDENATRWLECLVWPGEGDRLTRLQQALELARSDPPEVEQGDLRHDLAELATAAPGDATLVVFHSAVLTYVAREDRSAFVEEVARLGAVHLSNEGPGVLLGATERIDDAELSEHAADFLLCENGVARAWADPHGTWIERRSE